MPPALIAAGVGAVGTIGGALLGAHSANQAASQANQSQQASTAAQLQLGQESLALQQQLAQQSLGLNQGIYNSNYDMLSPWVSRGNVAGDSYNALLGLPAAPVMRSPLETASGGLAPITPATSAPAPSQTGGTPGSNIPGFGTAPYTAAQIAAMRTDGIPGNAQAAQAQLDAWNAAHPATNALASGTQPMTTSPFNYNPVTGATTYLARTLTPTGGTPAPATPPPPVPPTGGTPAPAPAPAGVPAPATAPPVNALTAGQAMNNFANSAGMQFQLQQGANALNNLYAAHGQLQSGAAMKAMQGYGQQTALNNYFMPYMGMLGGVSAQGAQAGSAVAGVGSSFGNTAAGINSNYGSSAAGINAGMGGALQGGADSASALAAIRAQNNRQMWNSNGGALRGRGSSFFPTH